MAPVETTTTRSPDGQPAHGRPSSSSHGDVGSESESIRIERATAPEEDGEAVYRQTSHVSGPYDIEAPSSLPYREAGDEVYEKWSSKRKLVILTVMSFCALLSPVSSTTILSAIPEVATAYHTTGSVIDASNAGYMVFMGLSPIVWGPISQVWGRRPVTLLTAVLFFLLSLATALSPNLASFFVFRALSAFEGTAFILIGSACLGDIYRPTERGTAVGWFMSGSLIGPAFAPCLGGIIVTYSSWRTIFWLQTALAGAGLLGVFFLVPETIHHKKINDLQSYTRKEKAKAILEMINPIRVLVLFRFWNLVFVAAASGSLVWNMYTLLTPIRYVLNPRFNLNTPLLSGLFYLAPGIGYLLGTFMGGRWADYTVMKWIKKRGGVRVPEDRLRSALPFMGIIVPGCVLIYGWTVEKKVGGIPVPVIALFVQGVAQLFIFPSLNSYLLDVIPGRGAEVAAANFFVRYLSGCVGTGVVLPIIQSVGVGWFSTISALLIVVATFGVILTVQKQATWRVKIAAVREKQYKPPPSPEAEAEAEAQSDGDVEKGLEKLGEKRSDEKPEPAGETLSAKPPV